MKHVGKNILITLLLLSWLLTGFPSVWNFPPKIPLTHASITVTTATGGSSISADNTGGSYIPLTGPTIAEGANGDVATGTIILSAPSGFVFNTGNTVTATITKTNAGTKTCFGFSATAVLPTASSITFTVSSKDGTGGSPATTCQVVFSGIQVHPSAGTPLVSGNITDTGTATITGLTSSTNLGTLTEVVGAKNKLIITTQPSTTAAAGTDFTIKPVVKMEDQFGNVETGDNTSTITEAVVLSNQSCGGSAGTGTLTSTPTSGTAVSSGVMTYTAMQYSVGEGIKICFSSTSVTSALSNAITVGVISIRITTSGTVSYGTLALNTSKDTTASGLNNTQTAQNPSTIAEDFTIKGQNTSCPWTLAASSGTNQYVESFSTNNGSIWTPLTTSYQSLATNIAASGTQNFDLKITTPTSTSCLTQQSVDVTVQAVAH